jgi:hypothetical protein
MKLYELISEPSLSGSRAIQSKNIREVLKRSKLLSSDFEISCEGFEFILNRLGHQINKLLINYCSEIVKHPRRARLISFLVGLSLLSPKKWYHLRLTSGQPLLREEVEIINDFV